MISLLEERSSVEERRAHTKEKMELVRREKKKKKKEAHLVDDAAGQSVRPPRGNAAARHPDERRANKLERREGEYARAGSPVHRTVFRRELRLRGREREGEKEREEGTKGRKERKDGGGERERAHRVASRRSNPYLKIGGGGGGGGATQRLEGDGWSGEAERAPLG